MIDQDSTSAPHPDPNVIALGIRQPWAELILRGVKTIEVRSTDTQVRGRIYLYASKLVSELPAAAKAAEEHELDLEKLPRGLVVGSAELHKVMQARPADAENACVPRGVLKNQFAWYMRTAQRFDEPLTIRFRPYGIWFYPWRRRKTGWRTKQ